MLCGRKDTLAGLDVETVSDVHDKAISVSYLQTKAGVKEITVLA